MEMQCNLILRKATSEDCDLLYNWRNEKECRENSLNTDEVPYETHCAWFDRRMQDKDTLIYIGMVGKQCVGMVRLDIEGVIGKISYSIDCNFRGQGLGVCLLQTLENEDEVQERISLLHAEVKKTNPASMRCFEKLGYVMGKNTVQDNNTELCLYTKKMK